MHNVHPAVSAHTVHIVCAPWQKSALKIIAEIKKKKKCNLAAIYHITQAFVKGSFVVILIQISSSLLKISIIKVSTTNQLC